MQEKKDLPEYYQTYVTELEKYVNFVTGTVQDALAASYELFYKLFAHLYPEQLQYAYATGKWTIAEVLGHIIDTERIFAYRALRIARNDAYGLVGYNENEYVENSNYNSKSFEQIQRELLCLFESTGYLFEGISEEHLHRLGVANDFELTPRTIGMVMAAHRVHHYNILNERYLSEKQ